MRGLILNMNENGRVTHPTATHFGALFDRKLQPSYSSSFEVWVLLGGVYGKCVGVKVKGPVIYGPLGVVHAVSVY